MTPNEAITWLKKWEPNSRYFTEASWAAFVDVRRFAVEALEFMRDHKCSARKDQEYRGWIEQERKNLLLALKNSMASTTEYATIAARVRLMDCILRYLDEPEPTSPKLTGDYFGAEF